MELDTLIIIILALVMDATLGEPKKFHPIVGLGILIRMVERKLNINQHNRIQGISLGLLSLLVILLPILSATYLLQLSVSHNRTASIALSTAILYLTIAPFCLKKFALEIYKSIKSGDLTIAHQYMQFFSTKPKEERDKLTPLQMANSTVEATFESASDGYYSTVFWFILLGPCGAVLQRVTNTLDSNWGHKNSKFINFGYSTAKLDTLLNYFPHRITASLFAITGNTRNSIHSWVNFSNKFESINHGPVKAAGAGSLNLIIYGAKFLNGKEPYGRGSLVTIEDIFRAIKLFEKSIILFIILIASFTLLNLF